MTRVGVLDRTGALLARAVEATAGIAGAEVTDLGRPADFGRATGSLDLLVLGPQELSAAGLRRLKHWRTDHPGAFVVACLGEEEDPGPLLDVGVQALVARDGGGLVDAVRVWRAQGEAPAPADPPQAPPGGRRPLPAPGVVVTVASATGGCGKTFLATNVAARVARYGLIVLLVDLDLQFSEVGAALQVQHPYSVYDALYDRSGSPLPDRALSDHLDELVFAHPLGFDVLAAPSEPALADDVTGDDARHVLATVRQYYDVVVVDTPPALSDVVLSAVDQADVVAVVATLDVPSLRNLTSFLDVMGRLHVDERRLKLVLNKVEDDIGITVSQAQDAFAGRFVGELPASRAASRSINAGTVVLASEPGSALSAALVRTIEAVLPSSVLPRPEPAARGRGRRWARRSARASAPS